MLDDFLLPLSDTHRTIHVTSIVLKHTVWVHSSKSVQAIVNINDKRVIYIGFNRGNTEER